MVTLAEAERLIAVALPLLPTEDCALESAHGRVLREPMRADRDLPPYDRATLDGYAVAFDAARTSYRWAGMQAAGTLRQRLASPEETIEIATGAVIPEGADTVIPYEEAVRDGAEVRVTSAPARARGNAIHSQGTDAHKGDAIVPAGVRLGGREIAVAAACGLTRLRVAAIPAIAIVVTGDELVDVENPSPASHQVRRSNDYALRAALHEHGFTRVERLHVRDQKYELEQQLKRLLGEFDAILLTGGVSKGKYDFLPTVLDELGVTKRVHGVRQRPGKPFWFGVTPREKPVFALPGNPVSAWTCFHRLALPALRVMLGETPAPAESVVLGQEFTFAAPLAALVPVRIACSADGRRLATPAVTRTSGDFVGLIGTDGFVELPIGPAVFPEGTVVPFRPWHART